MTSPIPAVETQTMSELQKQEYEEFSLTLDGKKLNNYLEEWWATKRNNTLKAILTATLAVGGYFISLGLLILRFI